MITVLAAAVPLTVAMSVTGPGQLPPTWAGDNGLPVAVGNETIYMYGDLITPLGFVQGTSIIIDGHVETDVLPRTRGGEGFYWASAGRLLPDGSLFVMAREIVAHGTGAYDFTSVDTDGFVVREPLNPKSWQWATRIEEGGWCDCGVMFSDQEPLAFTRTEASFDTDLYQFNPDAPWEPWTQIEDRFPPSYGTFAPIHTDTGWWGVTFDGHNTVDVVWADQAPGPYETQRQIDMPDGTYEHALNVIDGVVYHRYSTTNGRVTYQPEEL